MTQVEYEKLGNLVSINGGWLDLENDPGLFTMLIEDYGVKGVQVEEVYSFDSTDMGKRRVYGLIYLFEYRESDYKKARRKPDGLPKCEPVTNKDLLKKIFFAKQEIDNACATYALLNILLNSKDIDIGATLEDYRTKTQSLDPQTRGCALNDVVDVAVAHNRHAANNQLRNAVEVAYQDMESAKTNKKDKLLKRTSADDRIYHFCCFVPIDGRLYELDSLNDTPLDYGELENKENWLADCFEVVRKKIDFAEKNAKKNEQMHYSLMAVVPTLEYEIDTLQNEQNTLIGEIENIAQVSAVNNGLPGEVGDGENMSHESRDNDGMSSEHNIPVQNGDIIPSDISEGTSERIEELRRTLSEVENDIEKKKKALPEAEKQHEEYMVNSERRRHDYTEFIARAMQLLLEHEIIQVPEETAEPEQKKKSKRGRPKTKI